MTTPRPRRRRSLPFLVAVVAAVVVALVVLAVAVDRDDHTTAASRLAWPAGTRYEYDLVWQSNQRTPALELDDGTSLSGGEFDLAGTVILQSYGEHAGVTTLGLSFGEFTRHRMVVIGQDVLPDDATARAQLAGEVMLEVDPDGRIRSLAAAAGTPLVARNLAGWIASELEVVVGTGNDWTATQVSPFGRAVTRYHRRGARSLERSRQRYDSLDALPASRAAQTRSSVTSRAMIDVASGGHLASLIDDETIAVISASGHEAFAAQARVAFTLKAMAQVTAAAPSEQGVQRFALGDRVESPDLDRALLEQRIAGLTPDQLLAQLGGLDLGGEPAEGQTWLWRASGLLVLHPELCATLIAPFSDGTFGPRAQGIALDLLVAAGSGPAQAAMRTMVASPAAQTDAAHHALLVQRFTFLDAPDPDSVAFIRDLRRSAAAAGDVHTARAATYSLGAMTGALARAGDSVTSRSLESELLADLARATAPADRAALLESIGNTKLADIVPAVLPHAVDPDAGVRRATVVALASVDSDPARAAILELTGDHDGAVQRAALDALRDRPLDDTGRARLAEVVDGGGLARDNDAALVTLVAAQLRAGVDPTQLAGLLQHVIASTEDAGVRTMAQSLL